MGKIAAKKRGFIKGKSKGGLYYRQVKTHIYDQYWNQEERRR
jgi:hypothetical protein